MPFISLVKQPLAEFQNAGHRRSHCGLCRCRNRLPGKLAATERYNLYQLDRRWAIASVLSQVRRNDTLLYRKELTYDLMHIIMICTPLQLYGESYLAC